MAAPPPGDITLLLERFQDPTDGEAREQLFPLVEQELRHTAQALMSRRRPDHTWQATQLIDEAFVRLFQGTQRHWEGRGQFFRIASGVMRRLLVNHFRRHRLVRMDPQQQDQLPDLRIHPPDRALLREEIQLALDEALNLLEKEIPEAVAVFEVRFFGSCRMDLGQPPSQALATARGDMLSLDEVALILGIPRSTAYFRWGKVVKKLRLALKDFGPEEAFGEEL